MRSMETWYNEYQGISGIYKIENTVNGKVYIGSAVDIYHRWAVHLNQLRHDKHHSMHLQGAWNKYGGEDSFIFSVVEIVEDTEKLINTEQLWMDYYKSYLPQNGYNIYPVAGSPLGTIHTAETKKKISDARLGIPQGPHSIEHNTKIAHAMSKDWIVVSPEGEFFKVHNLREFCRKNNIDHSNMIKVAKGKIKQYKGWVCKHVE